MKRSVPARNSPQRQLETMPSDEYVSGATGGALKLKGGKIQKKKKKSKSKEKDVAAKLDRSSRSASAVAELKDDGDITDKAVAEASRPIPDNNNDEDDTTEYKTEAERRHEEAMKKKMQRMLEDPALASELRKTHKERVESLNTYLSKLSEHHDMPKIGPG
ncbi:hypothetical protein F5Y17DRAFT_411740 [Xylariaceae sp. FL0594]|nr:hypothetical protein F5Y17DRAFT_411740 [Xylariaceae sp. FL0594]